MKKSYSNKQAQRAVNSTTVVHDSDKTVTRPTGVTVVYWYGSVNPNNAENYDTWTDTI
jgi:hypothetical protein